MSFLHIPKQALTKLELPELRMYIQSYALSTMAKDCIRDEKIETNIDQINSHFEPIRSLLALLGQEEDIPIQTFMDIQPSLKKLRTEGYILDQEEVVEIYRQCVIARDLLIKSKKLVDKEFIALSHFIQKMDIPQEVLKECDALFTDNFEIKPDASDELVRIQRAIDRTKRHLDREFSALLKKYGDQGYLSDTAETIRNGRRVLSVRSEHKRQIKGIIHDESSGGRVAYVEPESILDINNDLFDLKQSKKREILRLLRELCKTIALYRDLLANNQSYLSQLDIYRAKAKFGASIDGICPNIKEMPRLQIHQGKHPLLMIHLKEKNESVVPFDLELRHNNRILIVSGPNAGGKTVLMKSVGLLQLMVQTAIPVPVNADSEFGIFKSIFVDLGDQQSLEDDLSTYSSHLQNMRSFLEKSNEHTLILVDELGSGTDPRMGGAIAEAILHELLQKQIHAVITTHYSNLKNYAHRQKGVVNAAMTFDNEELNPTYQLRIGKPGSSFAFELAEKSALPKNVIENAKRNAGSTLVNIDKMLADIQAQKSMLEGRLKEIESREKQVDQMRQTYEQMQRDIEAQRKKLKMMAKEYDISKGVEIEKKLQDMIREIREEKDLEKAKQLAKEEKQKTESAVRQLSEMEESDWKQRQRNSETKINVGDFVKVRKTGTVGQVERLEKGKAIILTGKFQLEAKLKDLIPANEPLEMNKERSVQIETDEQNQKAIQSKLDIRGMPKAEANKLLDKYFDQAILQGIHQLEIIHGKGSGVLRALVKDKAKQFPAIESIEHPPAEAGGEGVSLIKI